MSRINYTKSFDVNCGAKGKFRLFLSEEVTGTTHAAALYFERSYSPNLNIDFKHQLFLGESELDVYQQAETWISDKFGVTPIITLDP